MRLSQFIFGCLILGLPLCAETKKKNIRDELKNDAKTFYYAGQAGLGVLFLATFVLSFPQLIEKHNQLVGLAHILTGTSFLGNGIKGLIEINRQRQSKKEQYEDHNANGILTTAGKKFLRLLYHTGELFLGSCFLVDSNTLCVMRMLSPILIVNGLSGFSRELSIAKWGKKMKEKIAMWKSV